MSRSDCSFFAYRAYPVPSAFTDTQWGWVSDFLAEIAQPQPVPADGSSVFKRALIAAVAASMQTMRANYAHHSYPIVELEGKKISEAFCLFFAPPSHTSKPSLEQHTAQMDQQLLVSSLRSLFSPSLIEDLHLLSSTGGKCAGLQVCEADLATRARVVDASYRCARALYFQCKQRFPDRALLTLSKLNTSSPVLLWLSSIGLRQYSGRFIHLGYCNLDLFLSLQRDAERGQGIDEELKQVVHS